jgi:hypothetical protein
MRSKILLTFILPLSFLLTSCSYFKFGTPQEVTVVSFPSNASVYVNGEAIGITPVNLSLPRKIVHEVRLEKNGYNAAVKYFTPTPNSKSKNFIRFGLSEDLGYYVDLLPQTIDASLRSELVPKSLGADPYEKMSFQALEADRRLRDNEISQEEHKYIIEQIISFFEQNI